MKGRATYHFHVSVPLGGDTRLPAIHVNRTCWLGVGHRTAQTVFSLQGRDPLVLEGTPLDQSISCVEALLTELVLMRDCTPQQLDQQP